MKDDSLHKYLDFKTVFFSVELRRNILLFDTCLIFKTDFAFVMTKSVSLSMGILAKSLGRCCTLRSLSQARGVIGNVELNRRFTVRCLTVTKPVHYIHIVSFNVTRPVCLDMLFSVCCFPFAFEI